jgi:hypothetical protein
MHMNNSEFNKKKKTNHTLNTNLLIGVQVPNDGEINQ